MRETSNLEFKEKIKLATFVLSYESENDNLIYESESIKFLDKLNRGV